MKQLCKHLTINGIQKSIVQKLEKANIPIDVLNYMYDSSQGKVWDNLQAAFNENNRADVKQGVFSTIFYAKRTRIKDGYGQYFNSQYPTVVKIVKAYKKKLRKECSLDNLVTKEGTDAVQLSHMVTRLESCIFSRILKQLFPKKGLAVIGIHDAIAVIKDTETCNENKIRTIMLSVYRRYGLIPTIQKE